MFFSLRASPKVSREGGGKVEAGEVSEVVTMLGPQGRIALRDDVTAARSGHERGEKRRERTKKRSRGAAPTQWRRGGEPRRRRTIDTAADDHYKQREGGAPT
jgi:hypothetical protein